MFTRLADMLTGDRISRLEHERAWLSRQLEQSRQRCRTLLAENGRLRRLLVDAQVDDQTGQSLVDDSLLNRAFLEDM